MYSLVSMFTALGILRYGKYGPAALLVIGVIIFVHELGHFLAAKKVGIRVERFSIGFGPRLLGFKRGDTEYRISWFPIFGGYVKMAGDNPGEEQSEEEEGQFLSAPVSHRAIVAIAGPGMNMVLAVFAVALAYMIGLPPPPGTIIGYVEPDSPASKAGIVPGDKILSVDGYKIRVWNDIRENVGIHPNEEIETTLLRNENEEISLNVTPERLEGLVFSIKLGFQSDPDNSAISEGLRFVSHSLNLRQKLEHFRASLSGDATILIEEPDTKWLITDKDKRYPVRKEDNRLNIYRETEFGKIGVSPVIKPIIGDVEQGSAAAEAGFRPNDVIEAVNHNKVEHIIEFINELQNASAIGARGSSSVLATLTVRRDGERKEMSLALEFDEDGQLIGLEGLSFENEKAVRLNPVAAFRMAIPETIRMGRKIFQFLKRMIIREVPMKYVAGPIGIMQITMAVVKTGMADILHFAGFLSVNLGIVNLLPLFITDGGLIVFLIVEKLRGKPMSRKRQLLIQQVGIGFIIFLFLLITYNDILRLIRGAF